MKRFSYIANASILTVMVLATSLNLSVNRHYCKKTGATDYSFFKSINHQQKCCGINKESEKHNCSLKEKETKSADIYDNCCSNTVKSLQLEDEYVPTVNVFNKTFQKPIVINHRNIYNISAFKKVKLFHLDWESPPIESLLSHQLLTGSFLL